MLIESPTGRKASFHLIDSVISRIVVRSAFAVTSLRYASFARSPTRYAQTATAKSLSTLRFVRRSLKSLPPLHLIPSPIRSLRVCWSGGEDLNISRLSIPLRRMTAQPASQASGHMDRKTKPKSRDAPALAAASAFQRVWRSVCFQEVKFLAVSLPRARLAVNGFVRRSSNEATTGRTEGRTSSQKNDPHPYQQ